MTALVAVTPNWRLSKGLLPTDTVRPPVSNPIEWQYVRQSAVELQEIKFDVLDEYKSDRPLEAFREDLIRMRPDIVFLATTPSYLFWRCPPTSLDVPERYTRCIINDLPSATLILVGPHGTANPASTLSLTGARYAFRGELDHNLVTAALAVHVGNGSPYVATGGTSGRPAPEAPFRTDPLRYTTEDLDGNAPHVWISSAAERIVSYTQHYALVETSRGCSYDCGYCFRAGFRRSLRLKPLEAVQDELDQLARLDARYVYLIDETFGIPRSHASAVMRLLKERSIQFGIQTRPDVWTEATLDELAQHGCIYAELGTETLTEAGISALGKYRNGAHALRMTQAFRDTMPYVGVNIVDLGNPDLELLPRAQARQERDNENRRPPAFIPYPGTPWGDRALARAGATSNWDDVDALHATYDRASRTDLLGYLLRNSRKSRSIMRRVLRTLRALYGVKAARMTRYERRAAGTE